ncbi:flagellin [Halobacteriales archaeon QS_6_64_34]|nr:MAG: flagellin [Halobacteriales archaeon QS_6_64_34]
MGFSVSGSAALIFVAAFIGFGMFYSATANSAEMVTEAREDRSDRQLDRTNTAIEITTVNYDTTTDYLNITVENTGATELAVSDVDVLFDNDYQTGYRTAVEGDTTTDLWLSQETLAINATVAPQPNRVKIVTGPGVAATEVV